MPMNDVFRTPQVEEGRHNVILQNRCGNRLTALFHDESVELEFVYKPNAFRRKEFAARNFSNRDNYAALFAEVRLPEIRADFVQGFDYDPFLTVVQTEAPSRARNTISLINVADENVFALTARNPLVLTFRAHGEFTVEDGLLCEEFTERGEGIVSFVAFDGFEPNRYRVLEDGRHVIQIMDDEVVLIGGEENHCQMERVLGKLWGLSREELIGYTEATVEPVLRRAWVRADDEDVQRVVDLNRRVIYSGLDEGGACFGALNRIYHLIWFRDGSVAAAQMAHAGNPEMARIWTPFAVKNPSRYVERDGQVWPEYLQMVGTPWTKSEDDGLFYAVLAAYSAYQATGDDAFVDASLLWPLADALDHYVASRWDAELCMFGSDTSGETTLVGSERFGYDSVNGRMETDGFHVMAGKEVVRSHSLYNNVVTYSAMRMMEVLLDACPDADPDRADVWRRLADEVEEAIRDRFTDEDGLFRTGYAEFSDGSTEWLPRADVSEWEYIWALCAPFVPCRATALRSARMVGDTWPEVTRYGYCPFNMLVGLLKDHGMPTDRLRAMLADELREALTVTTKYPMAGALTEYHTWLEGWRALPFSAATFINTVTSCILRGLPQGVAVRAGDLVSEVSDYAFRTCRLHAVSEGAGDTVQSATVNGVPLVASLQVPESMLRSGPNELRIVRGPYAGGPRLHSSDARLLSVAVRGGRTAYQMTSATRADLVFERLGDGAKVTASSADGAPLEPELRRVEEMGLTVLTVRPRGDFTVTVA